MTIKPYSSARDEFSGTQAQFMDANENPFGSLNRYPDPHQKELKTLLSQMSGVGSDGIFIGNGSDELIDLALRVFCHPGKDKIIICPPTYGMYEVCAEAHDVEVIRIPLIENFQLDKEKILATSAKILFICSPNNPTGNTIAGLEEIIRQFEGIVFLDEAYIDFAESESFVRQLKNFPNLIVSRTLSKAWGQAAIRVGIGYSSPHITHFLNKIKPPYNVSTLNQEAALNVLTHEDLFRKNIDIISEEREKLSSALKGISIVRKVFPSQANFILAEFDQAHQVYQYLVKRSVITRLRTSAVKDTLRITVGTPEENQILIGHLKEYMNSPEKTFI
jgi:histidinol-phosphate aminotransferase